MHCPSLDHSSPATMLLLLLRIESPFVLMSVFFWTGRVLRTDVIVDFIKSLQIVTKTHELYLEEAPEEFTVQAYDDQGNQFR